MQIVEVQSVDAVIRDGINILLPQLTGRSHKLSAKELRSIVDSKDGTLLAAVEQGKVLGCLVLTVFSVLTDRRAWIDDLVVCDTARGRGIGRKLVTCAISKARESGARSVNLTCHPRREAANSLYRRLGFVRRETNVYHYTL